MEPTVHAARLIGAGLAMTGLIGAGAGLGILYDAPG